MGRSGVDVYPLQVGRHLEDVETFGKFLGGSPTNVAVAAARLGHSAGVVTGVGDDPFGRFVTREMERLGVDSSHVVTVRDFHTPVTFCELFPPDSFPLYFYREPSAPDLEIARHQIDWGAVGAARVFWFTVTGLSRDSSLGVHLEALDVRSRACSARPDGLAPPLTVVDLDYRSNLWKSADQARSRVSAVLGTHTHVQTADERILPGGTAYLSDVGMTGGHGGILGVKKESAMPRFLTGMPARFEMCTELPAVNGAVVEIDEGTGRAQSIVRIQKAVELP